MKTTLSFFVGAAAVLSLAGPWPAEPVAQNAPPGNFALQLSDAFAGIAARLGPSVVSIDITERVRSARRFRGGDPERETEGVGSGFIVDAAGYVLTNNHVVEGADRIVIRLSDGSGLDARVVGVDRETDLALLHVDAAAALPAVTLGDSDRVSPGHLVLALGSPFGFVNSVSSGIVSAKGRNIEGGEALQSFIQTDAAIHPGNSGGPLVNMAGEVVGVNTAIVSSGRSFSGIGFALPSNTAREVYEQLRASGRVVRGSIGIMYAPSAAQAGGVRMREVLPGGPASDAGLRAGDIIVEFGGEAVPDGDTLVRLVASWPVGTAVPIRLLRNGMAIALEVEVGDRDEIYSQAAVLPPFLPSR